MQQIPEEGRLFQTVDKTWKEVMRHCVKDPRVRLVLKYHIFCIEFLKDTFLNQPILICNQILPATSLPGLLEKLQNCNNLLDNIMKGLNEYLEKKRLFFPRWENKCLCLS